MTRSVWKLLFWAGLLPLGGGAYGAEQHGTALPDPVQERLPAYVAGQIILRTKAELPLSGGEVARGKTAPRLARLLERFCVAKAEPLHFKSALKIPHLYRLTIDRTALRRKMALEIERRVEREEKRWKNRHGPAMSGGATDAAARVLESTTREAAARAVEERYRLEALCERLEREPSVAYAEPNHVYAICADPYRTDQWHLDRINAEAGWEIETGSADVTIAVIDTGIDYHHEDIEENVTLARGRDFVSITAEEVEARLSPAQTIPGEDYGPRDQDPDDFHGHGTHVAGIAAARGDNGIGITGVMWRASVVPVRAFFAVTVGDRLNGIGVETDLVDAMLYCAEEGFDIINCSWGQNGPSELMRDAVRLATDRGCIVVAAAGNTSTMDVQYPAGYDDVVAVGAVDRHGNLALFSNFGPSADIYAPGVDILSLRCEGSDMYADEAHIYEHDPRYYVASGTSMAAPVVAGLCGILRSRFRDIPARAIVERARALSRGLGLRTGLGRYVSGEVDLHAALAQELEPGNTLHLVGLHFDDAEGGNGNWIPEPGERARVVMFLETAWKGCELDVLDGALGLETPSSHLTIEDVAGRWEDVRYGEVVGNVSDAFLVTLSDDCPRNEEISLTLTLTRAGATLCRKLVGYTLNPVCQPLVPGSSTRFEGRILAGEGPFLLEGEKWVPEWSHVQVEAGARLTFSGARGGLRVLGRLTARGTAASRITFARSVPEEEWGRLAFHAANGESVLEHVCIEGGLAYGRFRGGGGLYMGDSHVSVLDTEIRDCYSRYAAGGGICIRGGEAVVDRCDIHDNTADGNSFEGPHHQRQLVASGGLYSNSASRISDTVFRNNRYISFRVGSSSLNCGGTEIVSNCTFDGHVGPSSGWGLVRLSGDVVFRGNAVRNNRVEGGWGLLNVGGRAIVTGNVIANNDTDGWGLVQIGGETVVLEGNTIADNAKEGWGIVTVVPGQTDLVMVNNRIYGNTLNGGDLISALGPGDTITLENNLIHDNVHDGSLISLGGHRATLNNNVICGNDGSNHGCLFLMDFFCAASVRNTAVWNNRARLLHSFSPSRDDEVIFSYCVLPEMMPGPGNMVVDPRFEDPDGGDFRLSPGSPCRDAGDPDPIASDADGSRNDIGVHGGPPLRVYPGAALPFGAERVGAAKVRPLVLISMTDSPVRVDGAITTPPFAVDGGEGPIVIHPGEPAVTTVAFTPEEAREYRSTLQIISEAFRPGTGTNSRLIDCSGTGTSCTPLGGGRPFAELTEAESPYLVGEDIWLEECIVGPGTEIQVRQGCSIGIQMLLDALGEEDKPVRFRGHGGEKWCGFRGMLFFCTASHTVIEDIDHDYGWNSPDENCEIELRRCTITSNRVESFFRAGMHLGLLNTIYYFNTGKLLEQFETCSLSYSAIQDLEGCAGPTVEIEGSFDQDPMFLDRHEGNYELLPASPCAGAGLGGEDIGAYGTAVPDATPPTAPLVVDAGAYATSTTSLTAHWSSSDPESRIVEYEYRIVGGAAGGPVVLDWTSTGSEGGVTVTGLLLKNGTTYFFEVRARNLFGLWSDIGASDGITVREFIRGDGNADGVVDLSDAVTTAWYLFGGGGPPLCLKAADTSDDGSVDIGDAVLCLSSLFGGGPPLAPPSPPRCGVDPTGDGLTCVGYSPCE